jgi:polyhydroxybutyrate depolymerase
MAGKLEILEQSENLILVYPDAYQRVWNECRKMANTVSNLENIDENTFFSQLIMYFKSKYQIDDKKIFAIGFSGGGQMAYKLAMTMPAQFKGITVISANLPDVDNLDCPELKKPLAVMIANGTADPVCPYGGGEMTSPGYVFGKVRSAEQSFHYWSEIDGYKGDAAKQVLPDPDTTDSISIEKYSYVHKGQPAVVLLKVINGKHEFPKDIDMFLEAWTFFKGN